LLTVNQNAARRRLDFVRKRRRNFSRGASIAVGEFPSDAAIGDFDADGLIDLAVADRQLFERSIAARQCRRHVSLPISYGVGVAPVQFQSRFRPQTAAPDLATANFGSGTVSVLLNRCANPPAVKQSKRVR
jgi:hypothetical protein